MLKSATCVANSSIASVSSLCAVSIPIINGKISVVIHFPCSVEIILLIVFVFHFHISICIIPYNIVIIIINIAIGIISFEYSL